MRTQELDIVGGSSFDRYQKQSIESTYNMIISDGALVPYSGYKKKSNILASGGNARELYRSIKLNKLIAVVDDSVFLIDENLASTRIGGLKTQTTAVYMAENNNNQIAIVDGVTVYIYDYGTDTPGFTTLDEAATDPIVVPFNPIYITFQDTYFIVADGSSNEWFLSKQNNGLSWTSPLSAGAIQTKPDVSVAVVAFERQLFAMGSKTTEIWHDVGAQLFPYQRDNSISIDYGCLSAQTIAVGFGKLVWLASNESAGPTIMVSTGGNPQQISTDGINFQLDNLTNPEQSTAFMFEMDGHVFYQISFKSDKITLVYDFNTNKFFNASNECLEDHIAKRMVFFNNVHYFISRIDAGLYEMDTDINVYSTEIDADDRGNEIPRIRATNNFRLPSGQSYSMSDISITMEQGNTKEVRRVDFSMSKNGGASFGNIHGKDVRALPHRINRMRFQKLGSANDTVFQFRFWGRYRFVIIGATLSYWI